MATMQRFEQPAPLKFEGNVADNWERFHQRFNIYLSAIGSRKEKDEDKKVSIFLHVAGDEAIKYFNTIENGHQKTLDEVLACFEQYCVPKKNITVERYTFNRRDQLEGESMQTYVTALKTLAQSCEFGDLRESLIRDRLICGLQSDVAREKLLAKKDLTLAKAVDMLSASELAKHGSDVIKVKAEVKEEVNIDYIQGRSQTRGRGSGYNAGRQQRFRGRGRFGGINRGRRPNYFSAANKCNGCGFESHDRDQCPAHDKECYQCGEIGHFQHMCHSQNRTNVNTVEMLPDVSDNMIDDIVLESLEVHTVGQVDQTTKDWLTHIEVEGLPVEVKLDTGAQANVINSNFYNKLSKRPPLCKVKERLVGYDGHDIPIEGKATFLTKCNGFLHSTIFMGFLAMGGPF